AAGVYAAEQRVSFHAFVFDIPGTDRPDVQRADAAEREIAGADGGRHRPADGAAVDIARAELDAKRGRAHYAGIAGADREFDRNIPGNAAGQFEPRIVAAEEDAARRLVVAQFHVQAITVATLPDLELLQPAGIRRAGAALQRAAGAGRSFQPELVPSHVEGDGAHALHVQVELAWRGVAAVPGIISLRRERQQQGAGEQQVADHGEAPRLDPGPAQASSPLPQSSMSWRVSVA